MAHVKQFTDKYKMKKIHIAVALGLTLIYSVCYVLIKAGLLYAPPLLFGGMRVSIAGLTLLAFAYALGKRDIPSKEDWKGILILAFIGSTFVFGAMFLSPGLTGAGLASVLGNSQALFTVALATMFLSEKLSKVKIAALILGLAGIVLIAMPTLDATGNESALGIFLALAVSIGSAIGNIVVKHIQFKCDLLTLAGWQFVIGSLPLFAISALVEHSQQIEWSLQFIGLLLFLALVQTSLATYGWYWLIKKEPVGKLSLFLLLVPIFGLGVARLIYSEPISLVQWSGIAIILSGLGLLLWHNIQEPNQEIVYCPFCNTPVII